MIYRPPTLRTAKGPRHYYAIVTVHGNLQRLQSQGGRKTARTRSLCQRISSGDPQNPGAQEGAPGLGQRHHGRARLGKACLSPQAQCGTGPGQQQVV